MVDPNTDMREILGIIESYNSVLSPAEPILEDVSPETMTPKDNPVLDELRDLVFKLRSHTENDEGDKALGIEEGMQLAADMIENLIRRHSGETDFG
jgi:hypothetical protein